MPMGRISERIRGESKREMMETGRHVKRSFGRWVVMYVCGGDVYVRGVRG